LRCVLFRSTVCCVYPRRLMLPIIAPLFAHSLLLRERRIAHFVFHDVLLQPAFDTLTVGGGGMGVGTGRWGGVVVMVVWLRVRVREGVRACVACGHALCVLCVLWVGKGG
jgi:hypothetical protein